MVVVKFLVFVSEVVSIFSKILTWIIGGGQKDTFAPPTQLLGGRVPRLPPKSTPMFPLYIAISLRHVNRHLSQQLVSMSAFQNSIVKWPSFQFSLTNVIQRENENLII